MKLALVSLNQIWEDKVSNLNCCRHYISEARDFGAEMVIFPEMTLSGFSFNVDKMAEDTENSESVKAFSSLAREFHTGIIFGMSAKTESGFQNQAIIIDDVGKVISRYAKVHPFSMAGEDRVFQSGSFLAGGHFHGVNFGLSICYDLRFPELFSALAQHHEILVVIANWPAARVDHWNTLLKARAIENQVFMVGVNRVGHDGKGLDYEKSSTIYDANGSKLMPLHSREELEIYEIDTSLTGQLKKTLNSVADRRPELYRAWL